MVPVAEPVAAMIVTPCGQQMAAAITSCYPVIMVVALKQTKQPCISPQQLSVSYGNSTFYLEPRNSVIANAHIHCVL